jgi:hypothetical protein
MTPSDASTQTVRNPIFRSSSPPSGCREPSGLLPTRRWSPKTGLTVGSGRSKAQADSGVILGGRATGVPFTAVSTGPERTTTDNAEAASTCAASPLCR